MKRRGKPPKPSNRKCVRMHSLPNSVKRVTNGEAQALVDKGHAVYVPKHEWKASLK